MITGVVLLWAPFAFAGSFLSWRIDGVAAQSSVRAAALETALTTAVFVAFFWLHGSGLLVGRGRIQMLSWIAAMQAAAAYVWLGLRLTEPLPIMLVTFASARLAGVFWVARFAMRRLMPVQVRRPVDMPSPDDADEAVQYCERALAADSLSAEQRATVEANLARALVRRSVLTDRPDGLVRAGVLLERALDRPDTDPVDTFMVGLDLVAAVATRYDKNGDATGYAEAVRLLTATAERAGDPQLTELAALEEADYYAHETGRTDDEWVAAGWRDKALAAYESSSGEGAPFRLRALDGMVTMLLDRAGVDPASAPGSKLDPAADLDRAVELARQVRALGRFRRRRRGGLDIELGTVLFRRGGTGGPSAAADLDEAIRLARAWWRVPARLRSRRMELLARSLDARDALEQRPPASGPRRRMPWQRRSAGDAYRAALAGSTRYAGDRTSWLLRDWATWAIRQDEVTQAADALWRLVTSVPAELRRRYVRDVRERLAARSQGAAAEAGYWLARAGRRIDAVVAVEYARAVLLTETVHEEAPELVRLLRSRGREDLLHRRRAARTLLDAAERQQYALRPDVGPEVRQAWSEWDAVNHEIAAATGGVRPEAQPVPDFAAIRSAAAAGPLVYLAAAGRAGYALVVTPGAEEPGLVDLPGLTEDAAYGYAADLLDAAGESADAGGLPRLLDELWSVVLAPVVRRVPPSALLVLVPVGVLSLLPLHAAGPGGGPPPVPVTYAPNARLFARSMRVAAAAGTGCLSVLAVDAPYVPSLAPLPYTSVETARIAELYGPGRCVRVSDATRAAVLEAMPAHQVWHFACHSLAVLSEALDSALVLTDGRLAVREIMAQASATRRLAVLSACRTDVPDLDLLDEIVSFPGAFLRAGVAAVVGTHWAVDDRAASLLVTRFHEHLLGGAPPPIALALAQRWLRELTWGDVLLIQPGTAAPVVELDEEHLRQWVATRPFADARHWGAFSCTGA